MPEKKSAKAKVRINKIDDNVEEVFITCDDPYVNKAVYAKPGVYKEGEFSLDSLDKKAEE